MPHRCAWFQTGFGCNRKAEKRSEVNNILWGLTSRQFQFCDNYKNSSYLFLMYRIYAKSFYVLSSIFFEIVKYREMFDRQSLINVRLKIRAKFHGDRLVRFRDISHTVSKNLVSRKTRLKFQNVVFHTYPLLTFFTYMSRLTVLTIHD